MSKAQAPVGCCSGVVRFGSGRAAEEGANLCSSIGPDGL